MLSKNEKERISVLYDTSKWAERTDSGKKNCIHRFFLKGSEFPEWELMRSFPEQSLHGNRVLTYLWRKNDSKEDYIIRTDVIECNSWNGAHEVLLAMLADYQIPKLTETGSNNILLGDVGFIVPNKTIGSSIFSRANMVIRVHSLGNKKTSVTDMAMQIDKWFHEIPKVSDSGVVPEIAAFSPTSKSVKTLEPVALHIEAKDPLDRPVWYRLMVAQGKLELRNEQIYFSSEKPGETEISLFVVNENGMIAGAITNITIE